MKTRRAIMLFMLIFLLGMGLFIDLIWHYPEEDVQGVAERRIWLGRPLDLMIQVALMFAGTLGIRAMLPHEDGDEEKKGGPL